MRTKRSSAEPSVFTSVFRPFAFSRKRSRSLQPQGSQTTQESVAATGQRSSSNRILRSATQAWVQAKERAKKKPRPLTQDKANSTKRDFPKVESVIDSKRRVSQSTQTVRQKDRDKRQLDQIRDLEHTLHKRNKKIEEYQNERTVLLDRLQQLEIRHKLLESGKAEAEDALQNMHKKAGLLQIQLQECKDDLFRLQPFNEIADSTILQQYETLNQQIASWVDDLFFRIDDENAHREASGRPMRPVLQVENANLQNLLASSPNASEYWLKYYLHCLLQQEFFVEGVYLSCLPESYVGFIKIIEESMGALEPKRDSTTIDAWRSETLAALANHPYMKSLRSAEALRVAEQIYRDVITITPEACGQPEYFHNLHEKVVIPAMELALNIQLTLGRYHFYPCTDSIPTAERRLTSKHISEHSTMIDISTRRILKDNTPVIPADDGTIGQKLFALEPSLLRRGRGGSPDVLMRKAVYLVKLDRPLGKRLKGPVSRPVDVITLR